MEYLQKKKVFGHCQIQSIQFSTSLVSGTKLCIDKSPKETEENGHIMGHIVHNRQMIIKVQMDYSTSPPTEKRT